MSHGLDIKQFSFKLFIYYYSYLWILSSSEYSWVSVYVYFQCQAETYLDILVNILRYMYQITVISSCVHWNCQQSSSHLTFVLFSFELKTSNIINHNGQIVCWCFGFELQNCYTSYLEQCCFIDPWESSLGLQRSRLVSYCCHHHLKGNIFSSCKGYYYNFFWRHWKWLQW